VRGSARQRPHRGGHGAAAAVLNLASEAKGSREVREFLTITYHRLPAVRAAQIACRLVGTAAAADVSYPDEGSERNILIHQDTIPYGLRSRRRLPKTIANVDVEAVSGLTTFVCL